MATIGFSTNNFSVSEGDSGITKLTFRLDLSEALSSSVVVNYSTNVNTFGSATPGEDYTPSISQITFAPGEITKFISIDILGDSQYESAESFYVNLVSAEGATIVLNGSEGLRSSWAVGYINNDDSGGATVGFSTNNFSVSEGDSGITKLTFRLDLSAALSSSVVVNYSTNVNTFGSATPGEDYTPSISQITFSPGEITKFISVDVLGDTQYESAENFYVNLVSAEGAAIVLNGSEGLRSSWAVGYINNDDSGGATVGFSTNNFSVSEGDSGITKLTFRLDLSEALSSSVVVNYSTNVNTFGSATPGEDYTPSISQITFAPGEITKFISIDVLGDTQYESAENFYVNLVSAEGAAIVLNGSDGLRSSWAVGYINNDDTPAPNRSPVLNQPIPDQSVSLGSRLAFALADGTFIDSDSSTLVYTATRADGSALPGWLSFNSSTYSFSGTPTADDLGALSILVTASDGSLSASDTFAVLVSQPPTGTPSQGIAYSWKSHTLLSGVQVGSISAHAGAADNNLFDLRAAAFNAATHSLTVQIWSTPTSASANFDFTVSSTGATSASFASALDSNWSVLPNTVNPAEISVSGVDSTLSGFLAATQIGTLTLQYEAGTTAVSAVFSGLSVGDQSAADLNLSVMGQVTDSDGRFSLTDDGPSTTAIKVSRGVSDTGNAVTSADALATLRIAVGLNPNADPDGAGPRQPLRTSPYQFMAADVNSSGSVTSADALAILRMAVKLPDAVANEWLFVEETRDFWNETTQQYTLTRTSAAWDKSLVIDTSASSSVGVVGVLKGDVNGSWSAPAGSVDLDVLNPNYFSNLASRMAVPSDQWGV